MASSVSMPDTAAYRGLLTRIRDYLLSYGDTKWSARLEGWLRELDGSGSPNSLRSHVERSQRATGGMGSLGDLTICSQNGHSIADDRTLITAASKGLSALMTELYLETKNLLAQLPRSP